MAARPRALAKLTRPKLYDAVPRPRLFALLDEARERPIVWVCAPPGSGKSTLVASYLEARKLPHLWYQVDVGDADAATFVHYMRLAAAQLAPKSAAALPLFTSELQQNLARFARGFFRDLFSLLPRPCAVVLDNFHEADTTSEQRNALAQALEEIPEGINVIVVSRAAPPPEFARLVASRRIGRIDPAALRCSAEESEAIIGHRHPDAATLQRVVEGSDGWVAALVLLREHLSRSAAPLDASLGEGKEAIFQYFAGEIFNGARPENQRVLMLTAIPPSFTQAEAIALSGSDEAPRLLEYLYRRHLFIDRRIGAQTTYQYHGLFREFLLDAMRNRMSAAEQRDASVRAATLLAGRGQVSEALALFRAGEAWEPMRALIHTHALEWARQGRAQALSDWIEALPAGMFEGDPWLQYWIGRAWIFVKPDRGRPALERAFDAFKRGGDLRGQVAALGTLVTGYYYEWAQFGPLDRWLPEFERLLAPAVVAQLDGESELRARAACVIALLFRRPDDPALEPCAARLGELLDVECNVNVRMMAASTLFNYLNWNGHDERAGRLVARIAPVVADPEVTPLMQVWWRTHLSFWHYIHRRYAESTALATEARAIAARYGLEAHLFEIDHAEASALVSNGEHAGARDLIDAMERRLSPTRRMDWAYFHMLRSQLEQRLEHPAASVRDAERALSLARETGLPSMQIPHILIRLANAKMAAGDRAGSLAAFDEAIALATPADRVSFEKQKALVQASFDIDDGNIARARERLGQELARQRERGHLVFLRYRPDLAARLANFALREGVEPDFVRTLITHNRLLPPPDADPAWPYRLRIHALGGFELVRDGQPLRSTGKAQQRPLDLLKLIVAQGGSNIETQQLTAALWPDADGAAAKTSFDTTLHRLRKLLDVDNALVLAAGKLTLNPALVWTDVAMLVATLDAAELRLDQGIAGAHDAQRLLDAWAGPLLGDEDQAWITKPREALRARFVRVLMRLGDRIEEAGELPQAIDLYRRGLEADNLAEPIYRGLMRALGRSGNQAEALNVFRRCRELLSIVLGVKPSPETERLHAEIVAGRGFPVNQ